MTGWVLLAAAVALVLLLTGLVLRLSITRPGARPVRSDRARRPRRGRRPPRSHFRSGGHRDPGPAKRAAVVVNPTKFDDDRHADRVRREITEACHRHGWAEPLWLPTTVEDPGYGQARHAVDEGADVVCALGGDGTVRCVATALVGTDTPMGLLPAGTGNLLARNLDLALDRLDESVTVALGGRNQRVDTCRLTLERATATEIAAREQDPSDPARTADLADASDVPDGCSGSECTAAGCPVHGAQAADRETEEHTFLIMAGLGFDAEIMAGVPDNLKARMGWLAYGVSGVRHLRGPQFKVGIKVDDEVEINRRVRSVLVGNVGKLAGGLVLLPEADMTDGVMDALVLAPEGVVGWVAVAGRVLTRRRRGHQRVDHHTCTRIEVRSDKPVEIQLDGDTMGEVRAMSVAVDPLSLVVRVPA